MRTLADAYILEGDSEAIGQQLRALLKAGVGRRGSSIHRRCSSWRSSEATFDS